MVQEATIHIDRNNLYDPELQRLLRNPRRRSAKAPDEVLDFLQNWRAEISEEEAKRLDADIRALRQADVLSQR